MDLQSQALEVAVQSVGSHAVVQIAGELDAYTAPKLRGELTDLTSKHQHTLVLDVSGISFIDSSGLGVLVGAFKRARTHSGAVCLLSPDARMRKMLRITGLERVFGVFTDLDVALSHLDAAGGGSWTAHPPTALAVPTSPATS